MTVYIDPKDPETSFLKKGFSNVTLLFYVISGFLLIPYLVLRALTSGASVESPKTSTSRRLHGRGSSLPRPALP